jgi:linoleoyl-CoA desaturase
MFTELGPDFAGVDATSGRRRGLKTAIATVRKWRKSGTRHTPAAPVVQERRSA